MLALGAFLIGSGHALAEPATGRILVLGAASSDASLTPLLRIAQVSELTIETEVSWLAAQQGEVAPRALDPLRQTDRLITEARRSAAELDEPGALRRLAEAERLLLGALAVPGAAAFYAEVQLQLGVIAAQLGELGLAEASFARAARLDPRRRLLAGEAAPEIVVLAARVFDAASSAPEGELRIVTDPPGARVFVDDVERGLAPLTLRARVGPHALRFSAEGRTAYGTLFELAQGRRPEQRFVLGPQVGATALSALKATTTRGLADDVVAAAEALLSAAPELRAVAWLASDAQRQRRLLFVCQPSVCHAPVREERGLSVGAPGRRAQLARALSQETLAEALAWLHGEAHVARSPVTPPLSLWQRWYFWSVLGAAVLGGGVLAAVAAQPEPQRTLRVIVDPSALR